MCVYVCVRVRVHVCACVCDAWQSDACKAEDNITELSLSGHLHVDSVDPTWDTGFVQKVS